MGTPGPKGARTDNGCPFRLCSGSPHQIRLCRRKCVCIGCCRSKTAAGSPGGTPSTEGAPVTPRTFYVNTQNAKHQKLPCNKIPSAHENMMRDEWRPRRWGDVVLNGRWIFVEYRYKSVTVITKSPAVFFGKQHDLLLTLGSVLRPDAAQLWLVYGA